MPSRERLRQMRRLQLRARRAVEDPLGGAYRSVFKGAGIAFEEVRAYQPGDDVRAIDWNVTARTGTPFVKRYVEERELTVVFLVDVSASMAFGTARLGKQALVAEMVALLALSANINRDRVGLVLCNERVEKFVPPRKGTRHALRLVRECLVAPAAQRGTRLRVGLAFLNRVLRRRALLFVFSDFFDADYEAEMQRAGRRHDVVAVTVADPVEAELPNVGLLRVADAESGARRLIDTADARFRAEYAAQRRAAEERFQSAMRAGRIDTLAVSTAGGHLDALVRFFERRERRRASR